MDDENAVVVVVLMERGWIVVKKYKQMASFTMKYLEYLRLFRSQKYANTMFTMKIVFINKLVRANDFESSLLT